MLRIYDYKRLVYIIVFINRSVLILQSNLHIKNGPCELNICRVLNINRFFNNVAYIPIMVLNVSKMIPTIKKVPVCIFQQNIYSGDNDFLSSLAQVLF